VPSSDVLHLVFTTWLALVGLCIGSFANVVIARVPRGESIVRPRSHCPRCGHTLRWTENIPLLSWVLLRGKCKACHAPISVRYPLVELLTAALFLGALARFDWTWSLVGALMLITLLVPLTFIDLEHWLLPFSLTLPGIALGIGTAALLGWEHTRECLIGGAAGFLAFWGLEWAGEKVFKKEALGGGDKYLLAMIGSFMTFRALLGIVFLTSLQASVVGLLLLGFRGRAGPPAPPQPPGSAQSPEDDEWVPGPTNIPLGPWLAVATLEVLFFGYKLARLVPMGTGWLMFGG
jgi:leader peptidase (prepilin peptidase)/N-methyltransferase